MKTKYCTIILLCILIFRSGNNAFCQGLDASPAGVMISHGHPKGGWMFSYTYESMTMKDNLVGSSKVNDDYIFNNPDQQYFMSPQNMRMDMHMLMGMYGISGTVSVMVMANYGVMTMDMNMEPGLMHNHTMDMTMMGAGQTQMSLRTSGIGDVKLYAIYKLIRAEGSSLALLAGVNIPTGGIDLNGGDNVMFEGQRLPYSMQLGTGSFDLLPGITYLKKNGKISWSAQVLSSIRPFYNSIGYHYGSDLTLNAWAAYQLIPCISASLRLEGFTSDALSVRDQAIFYNPYYKLEPDANPQNYGGQRASGYAGLNYYIHKCAFWPDSKLSVEYGLPFYQNLNGPQLATQSTLYAGLTTSF